MKSFKGEAVEAQRQTQGKAAKTRRFTPPDVTVLSLLDGTRDRATLCDALAAVIPALAELASLVDNALDRIARSHLQITGPPRVEPATFAFLFTTNNGPVFAGTGTHGLANVASWKTRPHYHTIVAGG